MMAPSQSSSNLRIDNDCETNNYKLKDKSYMDSILRDKSYIFAISIVKLAQFLQKEQKEFVISNQILKSGTSTGALIREAEFAQSQADYNNKFYISLKEANETNY